MVSHTFKYSKGEKKVWDTATAIGGNMKLLITAGGTQEPIDAVRSITNHATGSLGAIIADKAAALSQVEKILFVCSPSSVVPKTEKAVMHRIKSVLDLQETLCSLITHEKPDVIIHSMAVSDYRVQKVTTLSEVVAIAAHKESYEAVKETMLAETAMEKQGKLDSSITDLMLLLEKTPKVITILRRYAPNAVIVGFKLLDTVPKETLLARAGALMKDNQCDFVLANDMQTVTSATHCGYLLSMEEEVLYFEGKDAIAQGILNAVVKKMEK